MTVNYAEAYSLQMLIHMSYTQEHYGATKIQENIK